MWQSLSFYYSLKVGESMVKVKALKPLGIKEGKVTVDKAVGAEFDMEEKDALAAVADGAVSIVDIVKESEDGDNDDNGDRLESMKIAKLKDMAEELGIKVTGKMKKAEMIEAIREAEAVAGDSE